MGGGAAGAREIGASGLVLFSGKYCSADNERAVRCTMRSDEGLLYLLDKCVFFLPKPPTIIPYEEIAELKFERVGKAGSGERTFDLIVHRRNTGDVVQLTSIRREEFESIFDFLKDRNVRIRNSKQMTEVGPQKAPPPLPAPPPTCPAPFCRPLRRQMLRRQMGRGRGRGRFFF